MAKAVVFPFLATVVVLVMVTSRTNKRDSPSHFGLNRRLGNHVFSISTFDSFVVKIQRTIENNGSVFEKDIPISFEKKNLNVVIDHADKKTNEYLNDNGELNAPRRMMFLFPLLDNAPKDGKVSFVELLIWNQQQAMERLVYKTVRKMESYDKDYDGKISFSEYLPQFSNDDIAKNSMAYGEAGWWMTLFKNADIDHDGLLDFHEFNEFLHPEDSSNNEIRKWVLTEKIRQMDDDGDGKMNFEEFSAYIYGNYMIYAEFEGIGSNNLPTVEEMFEKLDTNKDKFLEVNELLPIFGYIKPGKMSYAKYYASYLIQEVDDNGDGYLNLNEMVNHENTFYNTVHYNNDIRRYDSHDEL